MDARDLKRAEHGCSHYYCDIDEHIRLTGESCEFEDLLKPTFWSRNVDRLKRGDILRVAKEGSFDCELSVTWVGPAGVGVKIRGALVGPKLHDQLKAAEAAAKAGRSGTRRQRRAYPGGKHAMTLHIAICKQNDDSGWVRLHRQGIARA